MRISTLLALEYGEEVGFVEPYLHQLLLDAGNSSSIDNVTGTRKTHRRPLLAVSIGRREREWHQRLQPHSPCSTKRHVFWLQAPASRPLQAARGAFLVRALRVPTCPN